MNINLKQYKKRFLQFRSPGCKRYLYLPNKDTINIYYIPEDIMNYIIYEHNQIKIVKDVPNSLRKKVSICKDILEIDLNYMLDYLNVSRYGGDNINIKNKMTKNKTTIVFIFTKTNRIGLYSTYEKDIERLRNMDL